MRIYLTGFMGAGKSTVGRVLATQLDWPFLDLDHEIERAAGKKIEQIFSDHGEPEFRKREAEALRSISADPAVIATGGGCFIFNADWMLQNGTVIYLRTPFPALAQRIGADVSRPLWKNAERLFQEREAYYSKAHLIVDATQDPEMVGAQIKQELSRRPRQADQKNQES